MRQAAAADEPVAQVLLNDQEAGIQFSELNKSFLFSKYASTKTGFPATC